MKLLVGAGLGALIGGVLAVIVVSANWQFTKQNRMRLDALAQGVIGGATAGALIGAFL